MRKNVKSHFSTKQEALASDSRLAWVASSSCQVIEWPDYTFCPVVIQLYWPFNFLHTSNVWLFWQVTTRKSVASSSHENALECTNLINSSHSLTHNPYIISNRVSNFVFDLWLYIFYFFYFDASFSLFIFYFSLEKGDYSLSLPLTLSLYIYIYILFILFRWIVVFLYIVLFWVNTIW